MSLRTITGVLLSLWVLGSAAELAACGDKFLVASRGTRFQRAGIARRPANVLIYATPASPLTATVAKLGVSEALRKVGYSPTVVTDAGELARELRDGRWDLVLVDLADAASVSRAGGAASSPAVVAVAYETSGDVLAQARRSYDGVVRKPGRARAVVDVVDDALFARALRPAVAKATN